MHVLYMFALFSSTINISVFTNVFSIQNVKTYPQIFFAKEAEHISSQRGVIVAISICKVVTAVTIVGSIEEEL